MWVGPTVKLLCSRRGNRGTYLTSVTPYNSMTFKPVNIRTDMSSKARLTNNFTHITKKHKIFFFNLLNHFPYFSSILGKIPRLFKSDQHSLTEKCLPIFPGFPVPVGTLITVLYRKIHSGLCNSNSIISKYRIFSNATLCTKITPLCYRYRETLSVMALI